jgi:predicted phosphatase
MHSIMIRIHAGNVQNMPELGIIASANWCCSPGCLQVDGAVRVMRTFDVRHMHGFLRRGPMLDMSEVLRVLPSEYRTRMSYSTIVNYDDQFLSMDESVRYLLPHSTRTIGHPIRTPRVRGFF